jgi:hypothetical protein
MIEPVSFVALRVFRCGVDGSEVSLLLLAPEVSFFFKIDTEDIPSSAKKANKASCRRFIESSSKRKRETLSDERTDVIPVMVAVRSKQHIQNAPPPRLEFAIPAALLVAYDPWRRQMAL